jgi:hypothetical protein
MDLSVISQSFHAQQQFFAWEVYYALREPELVVYLALLRYLASRPRDSFRLSEIQAETGEKGLSLAPRFAFLSEHGCLKRLSEKTLDGRRRNPRYRLSDFGLCVIECISQDRDIPEVDIIYGRIQAGASLHTHRRNKHYDWAHIDPLLLADINAGMTACSVLGKKYNIHPGTLFSHIQSNVTLLSLRNKMIHGQDVEDKADRCRPRKYDWASLDPIITTSLEAGSTYKDIAHILCVPYSTLQRHIWDNRNKQHNNTTMHGVIVTE